MILVNAQYSPEAGYRQLAHAAWHGWTLADTIFPGFLFIVGVSLTLSTAARTDRGEDRRVLIGHAIRRALLIFACGVLIDWIRVPSRGFPFVGLQDHLQLTGALQKIAVCYLAAFLIFLRTGLRGAIAAIALLNVLYLALLYGYPVPGCGPGSLLASCNFPGYVDEMLIGGFRWNSTAFDPDGLGSILPAITSVLFGVVAGQFLLSAAPASRVRRLLQAGSIMVMSGEVLAIWVPINKQLWTPSFAITMAGIATLALAGTIWLVDGRPLPRWLGPLETFGSNAIAAYLISRLLENVPRVHVMGKSLHDDVLARIASAPNASLLYALLGLAMVFLAIWLLDRLGWRLKF